MKTITKKTMAKYLSKAEIKLAELVDINYLPERVNVFDIDCEKVCKRRATIVKSNLAKYINRYGMETAEETIACILKEKKDKEKADKAYRAYVDKLSEMSGDIVSNIFGQCINKGANYEGTTFHKGKNNEVVIEEWQDRKNGYSRSCKFTMTRREGHVYIKSGYSIRNIGGVLTFVKGKLDRRGMKCEWVEQGRAIADIAIKSGYLVRGEHIEAKSLADAQRINAEHREKELVRVTRERTKLEEHITKLEGVMINFDMSLASGNCRPGTQSFVNKVEQYLGREVKELSANDVLRYGKMFNVYFYAQRVVKYALSQIA